VVFSSAGAEKKIKPINARIKLREIICSNWLVFPPRMAPLPGGSGAADRYHYLQLLPPNLVGNIVDGFTEK